MSKSKQLKNAYNAGQLSPYMDGRTDLNKYYNGASQVINALILPHGGFTKRPGTIYKATSATSANLTPFEFSVGDALILEWTNALLRFYKDQAILYEPYGTEDLSAYAGNIIVHWKCNDNVASTVVIDADGATHNATASTNTNTAGFSVADEAGTANKAFDLQGTEYFTIGDDDDFSFGNATNDSPVSFLVWVNYETTAATQCIIAKDAIADEYEIVVLADGTIEVKFIDFSTGGSIRVYSDAALATGWHFIAVTYSGAVKSGAVTGDKAEEAGVNIYVDRAKVAATLNNLSANYTAMENGGDDVYVGSLNATPDWPWEGKINNVAILDMELSATQVAGLTGADSTTVYSVKSPYTTAQAFGIHHVQSADVKYIAHNDVFPKKLSRYADDLWTIEDVPFTGGPFLGENTDDTKLVGFARTGGRVRAGYYFPAGVTGILTASGGGNSPFNSNMVGALWLVKHTRDVDNSTTTFAKDTNVVPTLETYASGAIKIKGDATVTMEPIATGKIAYLWRKTVNGKWQKYRPFEASSAFSWTEDEDDVYYAMTRSDNTIGGSLTAKDQINYGIVKITAFISSKVVTVKVIDPVLSDNTTDNAVTTAMWAEGAFSTYRGFPRTVGFHEDRLWWASTTNNPDRLWSSKSAGRYEDMGYTTGLDDEAVTATVKDNEVSQVQWMMSRMVMAIGCANREYRLSAQNPEDPITPLDKPVRGQTGFSSDAIQPVMLNDSIFFLQRSGKKLGAMKFDSVTENFTVDDATLLAYGLLDSAPTNMAVSRSPDPAIWIVRTDGVMPTFTYEPKEEVQGWGRQILGNSAAVETPTGEVQSVGVIHGTAQDEIWVNVKRTISGAPVYYTELLAPRSWGDDIEDAKFVDSCITHDGGNVSTVTAAHLKGQTVSVFADGVVFDDAVANASTGVVTLALATVATQAKVVQVGLPYTMKVRSMRLAVPQAPSAIQTTVKRVTSIAVRYLRSLLGSAGTEYDIKSAEDGTVTSFSTDIEALYSTSAEDTPKNNRAIPGGFQEAAYTVITSDDPVPFTALSSVVTVEV